jgi:hypothetical protein
MAEDQETPEERRDKRVAYYAALVEAWLGTRMEKDRTLLALSAGGLALLANFLASGPRASCAQQILYTLGAIGFLAAVLALLAVLTRNTRVLEDAMKGGDGTDTIMEVLDGLAMVGFITGALATAVLAFIINSNEETSMSKAQQVTTEAPRQATTEAEPGVPLGYSGVGAIQPEAAGEKRGYSGVGKVRPDGQGGQSGGGQGGGPQGGQGQGQGGGGGSGGQEKASGS